MKRARSRIFFEKNVIDCHCHLDEFFRAGELASVLERAESAGVSAFVAVGTNAEDREIYRGLAEAFPGKIFYTAGFHPTELGENFEAEIDALEHFLETAFPRPVAVGEIGLDRHRLTEDAEEAERVMARQRAAFARQLSLAKKFSLPIVVHAREAFRECAEIIDASGADWRTVQFHCFSEDEAEAREVVARGGRVSFTGTLTYKNAGNVRRAALAQGTSRLMLETDCPYLAPAKRRGRRNEPAFLRETLEFAAELFGVPAESLDALTAANTREFFRLPA